MSKQVKEWARMARVNLLVELGAFCHWPGCSVNALKAGGGLDRWGLRRLEFDHPDGRDWEATGKSTDQRMCIYRKEAKAGKLSVLCSFHNQVKGDPHGRPSWLERWYEDLYGSSFGERVEA